jgi:hypothetical protein
VVADNWNLRQARRELMRYLIDQRRVEPETAQALYKIVLAWAADRGNRFIIRLQRGIYENPEDAARLLALGEATASYGEAPKDFIGRIIARVFPPPTDMVQVEGVPNKEFVHELTHRDVPSKAVSGDLCPVEDLTVRQGERILFGSYDYGRDLVLDLSAEELDSLGATLDRAGLDPSRVVVAPSQNVD